MKPNKQIKQISKAYKVGLITKQEKKVLLKKAKNKKRLI